MNRTLVRADMLHQINAMTLQQGASCFNRCVYLKNDIFFIKASANVAQIAIILQAACLLLITFCNYTQLAEIIVCDLSQCPLCMPCSQGR